MLRNFAVTVSKQTFSGIWGCLFCLTAVFASGQSATVSNVSASQREGARAVDISYDLAATGAIPVVSVRVSQDGGVTFKDIPSEYLSGDVGLQFSGAGNEIVWDADAMGWEAALFPSTQVEVVALIEEEVLVPEEVVSEDMVRVKGGNLPPGGTRGGTKVDTLYIGKHEVTWAEWKRVRAWAVDNGFDIAATGEGCADDHPVHSVSWFEAVKWCNAKSLMDGFSPVYYQFTGGIFRSGSATSSAINRNHAANGYRLPQVSEWEFAARGGNQTQGYIFSGSDDFEAVGWFSENSSGAACDLASGRGTWPAGQKAPNELGIYDMSGNVWEWCGDDFSVERLYCGSSFLTVGSAFTKWFLDVFQKLPDTSRIGLGFRTARSSSETIDSPFSNFFELDLESPVPEISVTGNGVIIKDGDVTPRSVDGTDFGSLRIVGGSGGDRIVRTFRISNIGGAPLEVSVTGPGGTSGRGREPSDFAVDRVSSEVILAGDFIDVPVSFNTTKEGIQTDTVTIETNDWDENPFTFQVRAEGVIPLPSAPILEAPVGGGEAPTRQPEFSWTVDGFAAWHQILINRNEKNYLSEWIEGPWVSSWTPPSSLPVGNYTWWVRSWSPEFSHWSDGASFVIVSTPPVKATGLGIRGAFDPKTTRRPTLEWNPGTAAEWSQLYMTRNGSLYQSVWLEGVSEWTPGSTLPAGDYRWWIRTWNTDGFGPWSDAASFTRELSLPEVAVPLSPDRTADSARPLFKWTGGEGATWTNFWVGPRGYSQWIEGEGLTQWQSTRSLAYGDYTWYLRTWNTDGFGPWSTGLKFSLGQSGNLSPKGIVGDSTPLLSWSAVPGAVWYQILIRQGSTNLVAEWIRADGLNDPEKPAVVLLKDLPRGTLRWWVRSWSPTLGSRWSEAAEFEIVSERDFLSRIGENSGVEMDPSGFYYEILDSGSGASPTLADSVTVHYQGSLVDGTVFDSSFQRGTPATFPMSGVIPGFSGGLTKIGAGGRVRIYIPPELGYGDNPPGGSGIPPGAVLVFYVELIDVIVP